MCYQSSIIRNLCAVILLRKGNPDLPGAVSYVCFSIFLMTCTYVPFARCGGIVKSLQPWDQ